MSEPSVTVDNEVLRLRSAGHAFARISRELGLERPVEAQRAFERALRRLPPQERDSVRIEELSRLDRLADRVKADTAKPADDRGRQLGAIDRLRARIAEDS